MEAHVVHCAEAIYSSDPSLRLVIHMATKYRTKSVRYLPLRRLHLRASPPPWILSTKRFIEQPLWLWNLPQILPKQRNRKLHWLRSRIQECRSYLAWTCSWWNSTFSNGQSLHHKAVNTEIFGRPFRQFDSAVRTRINNNRKILATYFDNVAFLERKQPNLGSYRYLEMAVPSYMNDVIQYLSLMSGF